jgi:hypothetical protein
MSLSIIIAMRQERRPSREISEYIQREGQKKRV